MRGAPRPIPKPISRQSAMIGTLIEQHKPDFKKSTLFGISLTELNKDQLMACVCHLAEINTNQSKTHLHEMKTIRSFKGV